MNEKQKAEAYVRSKCPELMELSFGCEVIVAGIREDNPGCEHDVIIDERKDEYGRIVTGYFGHVHPDDFEKIIGHPIPLQHWLMVLEGNVYHMYKRANYLQVVVGDADTGTIDHSFVFNLTTGQPVTEADYQAFNQIVGI